MEKSNDRREPEVFIHDRALVDADIADIGIGTRIWAFAHVQKDAKIGVDCNVGNNVFVESGVVIGDRVTIKNNSLLWDGVIVDDDVFIGPNTVFTNDMYPRSARSPIGKIIYTSDSWLSSTRVGRGVALGANVTVVCGISLGAFAMIGAGAVVIRDVLPLSLMVGNPARRIGWVCLCGRRLPTEITPGKCDCGSTFEFINGYPSVVHESCQIKVTSDRRVP